MSTPHAITTRAASDPRAPQTPRRPRRGCCAHRRHRGVARAHGAVLISTIALLAVVLALITAGLVLARADLVLFRNHRDGTTAYFRTRAASLRAAADLPAGYGFDAALAGPDATPGTSDDGLWIRELPDACAGWVIDDVADPDPNPTRDANAAIHLRTRCDGPGGARREVEIVIGRADAPYVPGAIYLERTTIDAAGPTVVDGRDHAPTDVPGHPSGPAAPVAAAASADLDAPQSLGRAATDAAGAPLFTIPAGPIDVDAFTTRLRAAGGALLVEIPAGVFPDTLTHVVGDAHVLGASHGRGLLVIDGSLEIRAPLDFDGVVIVRGGVEIAASGRFAVRGWLWIRGTAPGAALRVGGPLTVLYSSAAVHVADASVPLPRRAVLLGEREP